MSNTRPPLPDGYASLLAEVKERVRSAQYAALRAVNKELVGLYWDIGRMIVRRQEGKSWGKAVVERLAADLQADFPGVGGFSASNLWRMKSFFEAYVSSEKLAPLVREIAWSQNLLILERCTDALEREFYVLLPRREALAQRTQGAAAQSCRDRGAAGGWGMNRAATAAKIQESFEELGA